MKLLNNFLKSLFSWYERGLKESVKSSDVVFDYVGGWNYESPKISLSHGGLYINPIDWIKIKKN